MQFLLFSVCMLLTQLATAQPVSKPHWQQTVNYRLSATVLPQEHAIDGNLQLEYTNESPDTLAYIWFHLWPNAYANDKTAFFRQIKSGMVVSNTFNIHVSGFITGLSWMVNGAAAHTEPHKDWNDVVKLILPVPLLPHTTATITTPFKTVLPEYISRSGYAGNALFVAQWYPKPAVYDHQGWHPMPYLEIGEFYSEFGRYTVDINLPSNHVVAATGYMETVDELQEYKRIGRANYRYTKSISSGSITEADTGLQQNLLLYKPIYTTPLKTIRFVADSVHDFAFFSSPDFVISYDTIRLAPGKKIDAFAYYEKAGLPKWSMAVDDAKTAIRFYSQNVCAYPFNTVSLVRAPEKANYGGMEYPTIAVIAIKNQLNDETMDAVIAHEIGHNWFYGMLGSNERDYPWMDEGINSFFQYRYEAEKNRSATSFGSMPAFAGELPAESFEDYVYRKADQVPCNSIINQPAPEFTSDTAYFAAEYIKTAVWLHTLEKKLGKSLFSQCIKAYAARWNFRHPYPEDLQKIFEETSGQDLTADFKQLSTLP